MTRRILVSSDSFETRAALLEGDRLINIEMESVATERRRGHIYKGRVTAIEKSLDAAFVNFGAPKEGFLPLSDVSPRSLAELSGVKRRRSSIRVGDMVLVQVAREEIGKKGATLTMFVTLPGRYVVLMPFLERTGVSRKLDEAERERLRKVLGALRVPEGYGIIMRTSGEMIEGIEEVQADLDMLLQTWRQICEAFRTMKDVGEVYREASLPIRFVRDYLDHEVTEVLVDDQNTYLELLAYARSRMPEAEGLIKRYDGEIPLFSRFGVERQLEALFSREVPLPSGGSIVIGETEALVAIDVNSGRMRTQDIEETALKTNLEAAREIARQVVLRDLGGIIVVDFIDMESEAHRRKVEEELRKAFARDKARLTFGRISDFGLLVFSRQRLRQGIEIGLSEPCSLCGGTGRVRSEASLAMMALRRVRERLGTRRENVALAEVTVPVRVANLLNNWMREELLALEQRYGVVLEIVGDQSVAPNDIRVNLLPELPPDRVFYRGRLDRSGAKRPAKDELWEEFENKGEGKGGLIGIFRTLLGFEEGDEKREVEAIEREPEVEETRKASSRSSLRKGGLEGRGGRKGRRKAKGPKDE